MTYYILRNVLPDWLDWLPDVVVNPGSNCLHTFTKNFNTCLIPSLKDNVMHYMSCFSGGGWVNTSTGRSVVTSQMPPPSPQQATTTSHTELYMLQERVCVTVLYSELIQNFSCFFLRSNIWKITGCINISLSFSLSASTKPKFCNFGHKTQAVDKYSSLCYCHKM